MATAALTELKHLSDQKLDICIELVPFQESMLCQSAQGVVIDNVLPVNANAHKHSSLSNC